MQYSNLTNDMPDYTNNDEIKQVKLSIFGTEIVLKMKDGKFVKPEELKAIEGTGTSLKPATETWWLCRKPLAEKSVAANVLKYGTGALNIDKSRVGTDENLRRTINNDLGMFGSKEQRAQGYRPNWYREEEIITTGSTSGRWPSHLLLSHTLLCTPEQCAAGCPVAELDEQSGILKTGNIKPHVNKANAIVNMQRSNAITGSHKGDQGGASRYFATFRPDVPFVYSAKASRRERSEGCEALPVGEPPASARSNPAPGRESALGAPRTNHHPTVKAQQLMTYLVRLITPPGGVVLDCFAGSGSTLVACVHEGFGYIGIEQDASYIEIIRARVAHAEAKAKAKMIA